MSLRVTKTQPKGKSDSADWQVLGTPLKLYKHRGFDLVDGSPEGFTAWILTVPSFTKKNAAWHNWLHKSLHRDRYPRFHTRREALEWLEAQLAVDPPEGWEG